MSNLPEPDTGGLSKCPDCGLEGTPERIEVHDCETHRETPDCDLPHVAGHPRAHTSVYTRHTNAGPKREIRCEQCSRTIEITPITELHDPETQQ